ncbi:hypothetical protein COCCADRAFT_112069, partial [Bipolaris zeicola 26-R-13]
HALPRLGLHTGFTTKPGIQRKPVASARDILTHHRVLLVFRVVHLLVILSIGLPSISSMKATSKQAPAPPGYRL